MVVKYFRNIISSDIDIQTLSIRIGKLETKAIGKLIEEMGLSNVLRRFLSNKEMDIYYKSKYKLKQLLNT